MLDDKPIHKAGPTIHEVNDYFLEATIKVLRTTGNMAATRGTTRVDARFTPHGELSGSVNLTGAIAGQVTLSMSRNCAAELAGRVIGCRHDELSPSDITAVAGEIINQIAGVVRTRLWREDWTFDITLPDIATNPEQPSFSQKTGEWRITTLDAEGFALKLQISIEFQQREPAIAR